MIAFILCNFDVAVIAWGLNVQIAKVVSNHFIKIDHTTQVVE